MAQGARLPGSSRDLPPVLSLAWHVLFGSANAADLPALPIIPHRLRPSAPRAQSSLQVRAESAPGSTFPRFLRHRLCTDAWWSHALLAHVHTVFEICD